MTDHDSRFWHPFANMGAVRSDELVIERGEDVWVWDEDGRRYLDATASLWYANVGHGRPEIARAIAEQLGKIEAYSSFGDLASRPALELCERLAAVAPMDDARVFLGSGGGDGVETAGKLARRYFHAIGQPERVHVIGRTHAYHGMWAYGTSIGGIESNRSGYGEIVRDTSEVAWDSVDALRAEIERVGPERVAAFFAEPVIGAGGVYPPPPGYLEGAAEVCREAGVLFVADCVITGFGRIGEWFGPERFGVEPDLVVFAKGVTSGYLPLGGVIASGRVAEPFWAAPDSPWFRHGPTYAGHATCCAAALANLDLLEGEGLIPRGAELESELLAALAPLAEHPLVGEVRGGTGFLAAVALAPEVLEREPGAPVALSRYAREAGALIRPLGAGAACSPPLTATQEHIGQIADAFRHGLDRLAESVPIADDELTEAPL